MGLGSFLRANPVTIWHYIGSGKRISEKVTHDNLFSALKKMNSWNFDLSNILRQYRKKTLKVTEAAKLLAGPLSMITHDTLIQVQKKGTMAPAGKLSIGDRIYDDFSDRYNEVINVLCRTVDLRNSQRLAPVTIHKDFFAVDHPYR